MKLRRVDLRVSAVIALLPLLATPGSAADLSLRSGEAQVSLLELYTSEGCNSCPPADRWMSSLTSADGLWTRFVPVAFHVDYWDYIGWKDRFASPAYSQRQRDHATAAGLRTIYTPGFLLNGTEWRAWRRGGGARQVDLPGGDPRGVLELKLHGDRGELSYVPTSISVTAPRVHVALLGFGLATEVLAGENHGRSLQHDFVVLRLLTAPLVGIDETYRTQIDIPLADARAERLGIAAWVSNGSDPAPLQAVGGWVPNGR